MNTITEKLAVALREASRALSILDPMAEEHDAVIIDEALAEYNARRAGPKEVPVCAYCGSTEVSVDASVYWDIDTQTWEVSDIYDKGHYCNDCGGETRLDWRQANPEEIES